MQTMDSFRCDECSKLCIASVHYGNCCTDRKETNLCKLCVAYSSNIAIYFKNDVIPTGDKEIDFILKNKLNVVYNYEYLQRLDKLSMEISPESAFEIIKSIDNVEDHTMDDDPLVQLRENLCYVLQVDEDEIEGLTFQDYIILKMEELK